MRQAFVLLLLIAAVLYIGICSALYLLQERLLFFPERLPPEHRFRFPLPFREVTWDVDGVTLHALHFTVDHPKGVILFLHGNAGSVRSWGYAAAPFVQRGYDVLMPDYRGFGKSTGRLTHERILLQDALVAYTYLQEHYAGQRIILYGRSIGSGIAVYLATVHPPALVILETPYVSLQELAKRQFPFVPGVLFKYPFRTDQWITAVTCPVYLLHGTHDEVIPYNSSSASSP